MHPVPLVTNSRLRRLPHTDWDLSGIAASLIDDNVVLVSGAGPDLADAIMNDVATHFELGERLKLQATFASIRGHRENVGQNFMTVNRRGHYEYIPAHSEGTQETAMQLAAFYCQENSTDGGHTVLFNVDERKSGWSGLRRAKVKIDLGGRLLTQTEAVSARMHFGIYLPKDALHPDDQIIGEIPSPFPGCRVYNVLSHLLETRSVISNRVVRGYWDNVASADHSGCEEFIEVLRNAGLLRLPPESLDPVKLDIARDFRIWRSSVKYSELFKSQIIYKLQRGDLVLLSNLTWAHAVSNWTPGSGVRRVIAAFA